MSPRKLQDQELAEVLTSSYTEAMIRRRLPPRAPTREIDEIRSILAEVMFSLLDKRRRQDEVEVAANHEGEPMATSDFRALIGRRYAAIACDRHFRDRSGRRNRISYESDLEPSVWEAATSTTGPELDTMIDTGPAAALVAAVGRRPVATRDGLLHLPVGLAATLALEARATDETGAELLALRDAQYAVIDPIRFDRRLSFGGDDQPPERASGNLVNKWRSRAAQAVRDLHTTAIGPDGEVLR